MKISASQKVMEHVFGEQNYQRMLCDLKQMNCGWLNSYGANVRPDDGQFSMNMPAPITYLDGSPVYVWIISGHHPGEAEETAAKIEEGKQYVGSLTSYRIRPTTKRLGPGEFRAVIVRERWNKAARTWGRKTSLFESACMFQNRETDSMSGGMSALTFARQTMAWFPVSHYEAV